MPNHSKSDIKQRRRAAEVLDRLRRHIDLRCELDFTTPLELAVAAILAAQCTDKRVNMVTPALFKKYRTAKAYAESDPDELEVLIKSTGFYRNKAKSIRALGAALVEQYKGELPRDLEKLIHLPGIGRKTANLLMADAFGQPGLIIDTHQIRVNGRLGFTEQTDATKIEMELRELLPEKDWTDWSHALTLHGRYTCIARKPKCHECPLTDLCPYYATLPKP
ncbi:MAG: endonuclease III [Kiritimatiellae bacterium]|nr:endonuclease III [Kiritimatiellia bacterium]